MTSAASSSMRSRRESLASLAAEWEAEIARRAERVRSGQSEGKPAEQVFDRLESKLKAR